VGICAGVAIVISAFVYVSINQTIEPLESKHKEVSFQVRKHSAVVRDIDTVKTDNERLNRYRQSFYDVLSQQYFWPRLLYEMSVALPEQVWLEEIRSNEKEGLIVVKGSSTSTTIGVADLIQGIERTGYFASVTFTRINQEELFDKKVMTFELKCLLASDKIGETT
jgi:Tfp pilus assembly protein PilN